MGARVALVEKHQPGGNNVWNGSIPSKALMKIAKVAHQVRTAEQYGIQVASPAVDMLKVREYIRQAVSSVSQQHLPENLARDGIELIIGEAHFIDPHTILAGKHTLTAKNFLITTGAHPFIPDIQGLKSVLYYTYEQIFENNHLPPRLAVIGAGPVGVKLRRLISAWVPPLH
jgi:pyruvate/2-oxoglutarate dehydrogenase complex dihydrolipoamide dehydrogenase (E3) component